MKKIFLIFLLINICLASITYGQVVDTEIGEVEFIGLDHWDVDKLVDTLRTISPDQTLHACAADLRRELGFADASAIGYYDDNQDIYTVITVIEPEYEDQISYLETPSDSLPPIDDWKEAINIFQNDPQSFNGALQSYGNVLTKSKEKANDDLADWIDEEKAMDLWEFLLDSQNNSDKEMAYWVLNSDANYENRLVAAAILANFTDTDLTWWMLVDNLIYPDARVSGAAEAVINTTLNINSRSLDWQPALHSLQHLMKGTNLFAYNTVLEMLTETGISKDLATNLLTDEARRLLQAYLESDFQKVRDYGESFLSTITTKGDQENQDWINTLHDFNNN